MGNLEAVKYLIFNFNICKTEEQKSSVLSAAFMHGQADVLACLLSHGYQDISDQAILFAASKGYLNCFQVASTAVDAEMLVRSFVDACKAGRIELLKHLYSSTNISPDIIKLAYEDSLEYGHINIIEYLSTLAEPRQCRQALMSAMVTAARVGNLEVLRYCVENLGGKSYLAYDVIMEASRGGFLHIVKYLVEETGMLATESMLNDAAENGHLDLLDYLLGKMSPTARVLDKAAKWSQASIIDFVEEGRTTSRGVAEYPNRYFLESNLTEECIQAAMNAASERVHRDVIQRVSMTGFAPCTVEAMNSAAAMGHLSVVRYLNTERSEGCSGRAAKDAAMNGHLNVVKYLHENVQVEWTPLVMDMAAEKGHLEVVKYLHFNRTEGCSVLAMTLAASKGRFEVVRFLNENRYEGCTVTAMNLASKAGHLDVVRYLHFNRGEGCTFEAMKEAARHGHLEVVQFLHFNRTEGCNREGIHSAATRGSLRVVKFLHEVRGEEDISDKNAYMTAVRYSATRTAAYLKKHIEGGCKSKCVMPSVD
ncbi:hypothetical protein HDU97_005658 [Phlyctochytrium planicorne]|nr:hypothetical protein HDU97_005658 [Phlyctochytrium planicorne]